jgi:hypothetical protein
MSEYEGHPEHKECWEIDDELAAAKKLIAEGPHSSTYFALGDALVRAEKAEGNLRVAMTSNKILQHDIEKLQEVIEKAYIEVLATRASFGAISR